MLQIKIQQVGSKPFIQNVGLHDVVIGYNKDVEGRGILIQITDPDMVEPEPKNEFLEIYKFKFLDVEEDFPCDDSVKISTEQATEIANILKSALERNLNVIVHCHAGVCRSGAVCEVGVMLGFRDTKKFRAPNLLVKKKILQALNMYYY